MKVVPETRRAH